MNRALKMPRVLPTLTALICATLPGTLCPDVAWTLGPSRDSGSQEKHALRFSDPKVGDKEHVAMRGFIRIGFELSVSQEGKEASFSGAEGAGTVTLAFLREVLSSDGPAVTARYDVEDAACWVNLSMTTRTSGQPEQRGTKKVEMLRTLKGGRLEMKVEGGRVVSLTDRTGKVSPEDLQVLRDYVHIPQMNLLPENPVAVGESWSIEGPKLGGLLRPVDGEIRIQATEGRITGKLESVTGGVARVSFSGSAAISYELVGEGGAPVAAVAKIAFGPSWAEIDLKSRVESRCSFALKYDVQATGDQGGYKTSSRYTIDTTLTFEVKAR